MPKPMDWNAREGNTMQKENKFFEDLSKMMSSASGAFFDMKREVEQMVATQTEKFVGRMNFVTREEFEVVREMASTAREENEALKKRITELEKTSKTASTKSPAKKAGTTGKTTGSKSGSSTGTAKSTDEAKTEAKSSTKTTSKSNGSTKKDS
jgi:BMFP domain-containing protein YqiC